MTARRLSLEAQRRKSRVEEKRRLRSARGVQAMHRLALDIPVERREALGVLPRIARQDLPEETNADDY